MRNILKLLKKINEIHKNFIKKFVVFSLIMGILPLFSIIAPKLIIDEIYGQKRLKIIFIIAFLVLIFDLIIKSVHGGVLPKWEQGSRFT